MNIQCIYMVHVQGNGFFLFYRIRIYTFLFYWAVKNYKKNYWLSFDKWKKTPKNTNNWKKGYFIEKNNVENHYFNFDKMSLIDICFDS